MGGSVSLYSEDVVNHAPSPCCNSALESLYNCPPFTDPLDFGGSCPDPIRVKFIDDVPRFLAMNRLGCISPCPTQLLIRVGL